MTKVVYFAFRADPTCFIHALLNVLDLEEQGMWGEIVFEGEATKLVPVISRSDHFLFPLYSQAKSRGLLYGACHACAKKMGVAEAIRQENIPLVGDMAGHPSMSAFIKQDYLVITI